MKLMLIVVLALLAGPCSERRDKPYSVPSPSPTSLPKPDAQWMGPHRWVSEKGQEYKLVCGQSGKIIASVTTGANDSAWSVWGGEGRGYGEYLTLDQAKAKAEQIVADPDLTHELLHCP